MSTMDGCLSSPAPPLYMLQAVPRRRAPRSHVVSAARGAWRDVVILHDEVHDLDCLANGLLRWAAHVNARVVEHARDALAQHVLFRVVHSRSLVIRSARCVDRGAAHRTSDNSRSRVRTQWDTKSAVAADRRCPSADHQR